MSPESVGSSEKLSKAFLCVSIYSISSSAVSLPALQGGSALRMMVSWCSKDKVEMDIPFVCCMLGQG